jgi:hypothetical protein
MDCARWAHIASVATPPPPGSCRLPVAGAGARSGRATKGRWTKGQSDVLLLTTATQPVQHFLAMSSARQMMVNLRHDEHRRSGSRGRYNFRLLKCLFGQYSSQTHFVAELWTEGEDGGL